VAQRAGVALSVLDRHFESKADLFSEAVLVPFVSFLERMSADWLRQRDEPLRDEPLMHMVLGDMHQSLSAHRRALDGLVLAREELGEDILTKLRSALDDMFRQLRLMAELEAERRGWFSPIGLDLTLRILMGMVVGTTAFDWVLLPEQSPPPEQLVDEMSKLALWGLERRPHT
jgi:AcrR family transcriptional regulator